MIDVAFIFRENQQCLHDRFADTNVIEVGSIGEGEVIDEDSSSGDAEDESKPSESDEEPISPFHPDAIGSPAEKQNNGGSKSNSQEGSQLKD